MASYISSNDNRLYAAVETSYGQVPTPAAGNRIPALQLTARQRTEKAVRRDKTGSRTFAGDPSGLRRSTEFALKTYMTGWSDQTREPAYGPLFQACMGPSARMWAGGVIASASAGGRVAFTAAHSLHYGQAIVVGGEIRFVASVLDAQTIQLNAPFTGTPAGNISALPSATYAPGPDLPSATIFDYWSPASALQRVLTGAAINEMRVSVNGDFHEFEFSGEAADILDSQSFESGQSGLSAFPQEPASQLNYSIIPGHLGQVWIGTAATQFSTVTKATLTFNNGLDLRSREFGTMLARGISPGIRDVSMELSLYQQDDSATQSLYQAARNRSPVSVLLQLGQQPGQLFGIYMPAVALEVPEFDDSDKRQQWHFVNCRAQGGVDDELFVAFG